MTPLGPNPLLGSHVLLPDHFRTQLRSLAAHYDIPSIAVTEADAKRIVLGYTHTVLSFFAEQCPQQPAIAYVRDLYKDYDHTTAQEWEIGKKKCFNYVMSSPDPTHAMHASSSACLSGCYESIAKAGDRFEAATRIPIPRAQFLALLSPHTHSPELDM